MKKVMRSIVLPTIIVSFCLLAAIYSAHGQMVAEELPVGTMVTVKAPDEPVNRKTVPKKILRYCSYESQKAPDYVKVARFPVVPGQKYTFYDCHPAPSDRPNILIHLSGDTPLSNYTYAYGPSKGFTRSFISRAQQPWPIRRGEGASCDLIRHNITIAPQSEHNNLYVILNFSKPGLSTKIMLKHPADSDDIVTKSADRSHGTVWRAPFLLTNIPGEAASAVKPPVTPSKQQPPVTSQPLVIGEAPTGTSAGAPLLPYNCKVQAYINRGDYDTFRFDFPGGKVRIASEGGLDLVADLWDAKGNRLARDGQDAKKDFLIEKDLPPGTYYIQVRFMYHAGEGPYTLILGNGRGPLYKEANP